MPETITPRKVALAAKAGFERLEAMGSQHAYMHGGEFSDFARAVRDICHGEICNTKETDDGKTG